MEGKCDHPGCDKEAVVKVVFPFMQAKVLGCEDHRYSLQQALEQARAEANEIIENLGLGRLDLEKGPYLEVL